MRDTGGSPNPCAGGTGLGWQFWGCCLQQEWDSPVLLSCHRSGVWHLEGTPYVSSDGSAVPRPCHPALPLPGPVLRVPSGCRSCWITVQGAQSPCQDKQPQAQGFVCGFCRVHGCTLPSTGSAIHRPGEVAPGSNPFLGSFAPLGEVQPHFGLAVQGKGCLTWMRRKKLSSERGDTACVPVPDHESVPPSP